MDCQQFEKWLAASEATGSRDKAGAEEHLAACRDCRRLWDLDTQAESQLRSLFAAVDPPDHLWARIEAGIAAKTPSAEAVPTPPRRWVWRIPAVALAGLLLIVGVQLFHHPPITLSQVAYFAVNEHFKPNLALDVRSDQGQRYQPWFASTFDFPVVLPNLDHLGLVLKGARACNVEGKQVVYLICNKSGEKTSLFIFNAADVALDFSAEKRYRVTDRSLQIDLWRENDLIYVKASASSAADRA